LLALLFSPLIGFAGGALLTWIAYNVSGENKNQKTTLPIMRWLHILSSAALSFSHGSNDGQKTMGIITLILAVNFAQYGYTTQSVPLWVIASAAAAIAMGTIVGGWRVIRTVGSKISKERLSHSQGFGASMSTAVIIICASTLGAPISTTHTLSSAVAGGTLPVYGAGKLNSKTLYLIMMAWVLTLPVAATLAAFNYFLSSLIVGKI
jgi:PiT family inorganic phosphate transporter